MKRDSIDELFGGTEEIKAPSHFTQRVMGEVRKIAQKRHCKPRAALIIDMKRLGISMVMTAVLIFITVLLPADKADLFHHTVQAQTQMMTRPTDYVNGFMDDSVRAFNKWIEDFQKKLDKMKEAYRNDR